MKVGDLVKYDGGDFELFLDWVGLVINVNPLGDPSEGYARIKWNKQNGITSDVRVFKLRVIT